PSLREYVIVLHKMLNSAPLHLDDTQLHVVSDATVSEWVARANSAIKHLEWDSFEPPESAALPIPAQHGPATRCPLLSEVKLKQPDLRNQGGYSRGDLMVQPYVVLLTILTEGAATASPELVKRLLISRQSDLLETGRFNFNYYLGELLYYSGDSAEMFA